MKKSIFISTLLLVTILCMNVSQNRSLSPILPIGEFHINVLKILPCDLTKNNKMQCNWYLNKTSATSSEFKGNITLDSIPIDDNLILHVYFDVRDSTGKWIPSKLVIKKEKACTMFKSFINTQYFDSIGWNGTCPIQPGVYNTSGFPATNMDKALKNLPKIAPYGKYKFHLNFETKNNENIGCFLSVLELKRP